MKYILDGHTPRPEPDINVWGRWFKTADRVVARAEIGGGGRVSTVFLGMDHGFGDGPPVLFETLVFGGPFEGEMERYHTWDEAEAGHASMVTKVRAAADAAMAQP